MATPKPNPNACPICGRSTCTVGGMHGMARERYLAARALADADRAAGAGRRAGERALARENQRAARDLA
jgi:hypothetical protein